MDQIKSGAFIAQLRKEKGYTQAQLAQMLHISDKTVSKWERGKGMPEVSLMLPLCDALGITVNELLTGEKLTEADYKQKAEENMMELVKEKTESKRNIFLSIAVCFLAFLAAYPMILLAGVLEMPVWLRVLLICIGAVEICGGIAIAVVLDRRAGTFECPKCGKRFVPSFGAYMAGMHTLTRRQLKCPHCGKISMCKRRLTH